MAPKGDISCKDVIQWCTDCLSEAHLQTQAQFRVSYSQLYIPSDKLVYVDVTFLLCTQHGTAMEKNNKMIDRPSERVERVGI